MKVADNATGPERRKEPINDIKAARSMAEHFAGVASCSAQSGLSDAAFGASVPDFCGKTYGGLRTQKTLVQLAESGKYGIYSRTTWGVSTET